jgi:hypothetical protein
MFDIDHWFKARDTRRWDLLRKLIEAHATSLHAMEFWSNMGVNIDCEPWSALTKAKELQKEIETELQRQKTQAETDNEKLVEGNSWSDRS